MHRPATLPDNRPSSLLCCLCTIVQIYAFVVSAVRQATTMDVLIDALERARLHPVDVTSAIAASREPAFLFADAARGHARDAFRAFACSATRVA